MIAPPYDVISPQEQAALYDASPYNVVRLEYPEGAQTQALYETAASTLRSWRDEGVLQRDPTPSFYLIRHRFRHGDRTLQRYELMAALRLEPWSSGDVLPHELTSEDAKRDRLALMHACRANLSPIMALYHDADSAVARLLHTVAMASPSERIKDGSNGDADYGIWLINDTEQTTALQDALHGPVYIADGHHRYETALQYQEEAPALASPGVRAADYIMTSLTALEDPGLLSLPYHRLLRGLPEDARGRLERQSKVYFDTEEVAIEGLTPEEVGALFESRIGAGDGPLMGLVHRGNDTLRLLRPRDPEIVSGLLSEHSEAWGRLSPCLFADVLLQPSLGVRQQEAEARGWLSYTRDTVEAVAAVRTGDFDMAFLLDGVPLPMMTTIAQAGERLPHKSTYFHPKLATGLVINPLDGAL